MTLYNVHIYREMRLLYEGIDAPTPEEAAEIAGDKPTGDADGIEDCEGCTSTALVDVVGDEEYEQSRWIDFEPERLRKTAPLLLEALRDCIGQIHALLPRHQQSDSTLDNIPAVLKARAAIAQATRINQATTERSHDHA
jgi:hypothetical protein